MENCKIVVYTLSIGYLSRELWQTTAVWTWFHFVGTWDTESLFQKHKFPLIFRFCLKKKLNMGNHRNYKAQKSYIMQNIVYDCMVRDSTKHIHQRASTPAGTMEDRLSSGCQPLTVEIWQSLYCPANVLKPWATFQVLIMCVICLFLCMYVCGVCVCVCVCVHVCVRVTPDHWCACCTYCVAGMCGHAPMCVSDLMCA